MPRRSSRLQETAYYTEQGTPFFSYREILIGVFRRRKHFLTNTPMNPNHTERLDPMDNIASDLPLEHARNSTVNRNYQASVSLTDVKDAETNSTLTWTPDDMTTANQGTQTLIGETREMETQTTTTFRRRKHFLTNTPMNPTHTERLDPIDNIASDLPLEHARNSTVNRNYQASASLTEVKDAETNTTLTWTPDDMTKANQSTQTLIGETREMETQTTNVGPITKTIGTQTIKITEDNVKTSGSSFWKFLSGVLLVLLLLQTYGHSGSTTDNSVHFVLQEIQEELRSLQQRIDTSFPLADTLPNFALESQGARTLQHLSSDTYWPEENFLWDKIFNWWYSSKKQRGVIQGHSTLNSGECWPFSGGRGHLLISLSHPVSISHVTLGHIAKSQSPHGSIASAPKEFSIYGMTETDEEGTLLGRMVYNQDGTPHQSFALPNPDKGVFRYVKLQIENNWGNIDSTCLYSFRVHGKPQPTASEFH